MYSELQNRFADVIRTKYRHTVEIEISTKYQHGSTFMSQITESSDRGPCYFDNEYNMIRRSFVQGQRKAYTNVYKYWTKADFLELSIDQQVDALVYDYKTNLKNNRVSYGLMAVAEDTLTAKQREQLPDLRLRRKTAVLNGYILNVSWKGYGNNLLYGTQNEVITIWHNNINELEKRLVYLAHWSKQNSKAAERGYTLDLPLQAFIKEEGLTTEQFISIMHESGLLKVERSSGTVKIGTQKIGVSFVSGKITSRIAINNNLKWSKGCLTARGVNFPDSVAQAIIGQPLRKVVDHPWLEGLQVTTVNQSKSNNGDMCATFMTKVA